MKHNITSLNTKKAMAESLKKAMKTKPFSKITVTEIIKDCGINRKTFYYHFEDLYSLLKWMFEVEAIEVVKNYDLLVDSEEAICFVMDYVEKNDYIINCAYDSIGKDEMKRFFYADFIDLVSSVIDRAEQESNMFLDPDFKRFICGFYTEALAGSLIDWVQNPTLRNREKAINYFSFILKSSLTAILNDAQNTPFGSAGNAPV